MLYQSTAQNSMQNATVTPEYINFQEIEFFVCAHLGFRIEVFFPKLNYNNNSNKTINGVAGHNTPKIKSKVIVGKIPHKTVINISDNFSCETSISAEQGSLQCNYICSLRAVESLLSIVMIFFKR